MLSRKKSSDMQSDMVWNLLKFVHGTQIGKIFVQTGAMSVDTQEQKQEKFSMVELANLWFYLIMLELSDLQFRKNYTAEGHHVPLFLPIKPKRLEIPPPKNDKKTHNNSKRL